MPPGVDEVKPPHRGPSCPAIAAKPCLVRRPGRSRAIRWSSPKLRSPRLVLERDLLSDSLRPRVGRRAPLTSSSEDLWAARSAIRLSRASCNDSPSPRGGHRGDGNGSPRTPSGGAT
eukprot:6464002-Amphidinium_carterae.1